MGIAQFGGRGRSSFLTIMTGGTQLVEGAHLIGGDTRFFREAIKSRGFYDYRLSFIQSFMAQQTDESGFIKVL